MENLAKVDQITSLHKNNELQLLCFRLDAKSDLYATNVFKIREVIKYDGDITSISYEKSSLIEGLITIRDHTIPLIDLKKWFYYDANDKDKDLSQYVIKNTMLNGDIIMICEFSRWTIGVRIYEADRILSKKWTEIEQSSGIVGTQSMQGLPQASKQPGPAYRSALVPLRQPDVPQAYPADGRRRQAAFPLCMQAEGA